MRSEHQILRKIEHIDHRIKVNRQHLKTLKEDCHGLVWFMMEREKELNIIINNDSRQIKTLLWVLGKLQELTND